MTAAPRHYASNVIIIDVLVNVIHNIYNNLAFYRTLSLSFRNTTRIIGVHNNIRNQLILNHFPFDPGIPRPNTSYLPAPVLPGSGRQGVGRLLPHGGQLPRDLQRAGQGPVSYRRWTLAQGPRASQTGTLCARPVQAFGV